MRLKILPLVATLTAAAGLVGGILAHDEKEAMKSAIYKPDDLQWQDGPASLPPGAIVGGVVGGIGGFIAGGALTEPAYSAITGDPDPQLSFWEGFGMGLIIGIPVGVVAGIVGPAGWALYTGAFWTSSIAYYLGLTVPGATMTVSHWGKPGVQSGSWVMVGRPDWLSWLLAGGPQVGPYSSGLPYQVPVQSVVTPYGGGAPWYEWTKFWQRMIQ